jgi:hypothetical protein
MKAPNNKPTEKTEQRIEAERLGPKITKLGDLGDDTQFIELDIKDLVKQMLTTESVQQEITKEATKRLDKEETVGAVKSILSEYFNAFIILGYGVNGDRIVIKETKSDMGDDSIIEVLRYVLMKMVHGN